jgi:1,2-diacylglycerol 3-alpha-glucosyltransferase
MTYPSRVPHVLLACAGLDHAHRGYESFARECFEALRDEPGIRIELVKGSGASGPAERALPTLRRDRLPARSLGRALGFRPFRLEGLAFGLSLQPLLTRRRPDIVYLSEWDTARALGLLRRVTRQRFKLLYCNGGFASRGFERFDRVQELTPAGRDWVLEHGADPDKHTVLPLGFELPPRLEPLSEHERLAVRERRGLPPQRQIVVSLAALNRAHKRLDYLIEEIAALDEPRPYLLLAGEPDDETPALRSLAARRLGPDGCSIRTFSLHEVPDVLRACDVFVLASLFEMQGRALIEAAGHGIPCVAHDSPVMRFALGDYGLFGDLTATGTVVRLLGELAAMSPEALRARLDSAHKHVYERFSWDRLRPRYVELFSAVANSTVSSSSGDEVRRNWR